MASAQTFGCQMNARDSEKIKGILETVGYKITESEKADFIVYNTCTVRENANLKVYGHLGLMGHEKKNNPDMMIALCGCMMQEPQVVEKIKKSYRFVNLVFGTHNLYKFAELVYTSMISDRMIIDVWKDTDKIVGRSALRPEIFLQIRRQHHVWLQQFLQLLYRSLCAWPGTEPGAGGDHQGDPFPRGRRRGRSHASGPERQLLR